MKSTGITRPIDDLGRIVLPKELRKVLKIVEKDLMEIYVEGSKIVLQKYSSSCVFCENSEKTIEYNEKNVCIECIESLNADVSKIS